MSVADGELLELARFARECICHELGGPTARPPVSALAVRLGASFVTLRWRNGQLQGCIGSLEARRPLVADVAHNGLAAAFEDPRGTPLSLHDLDELNVEVSVLSALERVAFDGTERGARAALRPGVDGVVLAYHGRRGTFLPQMWEQLPTSAEFLRELKMKARLPYDFWGDGVELYRYTVAKVVDPAPRAQTAQEAEV
jgi:AmmeMemoRadiSam system protein A